MRKDIFQLLKLSKISSSKVLEISSTFWKIVNFIGRACWVSHNEKNSIIPFPFENIHQLTQITIQRVIDTSKQTDRIFNPKNILNLFLSLFEPAKLVTEFQSVPTSATKKDKVAQIQINTDLISTISHRLPDILKSVIW